MEQLVAGAPHGMVCWCIKDGMIMGYSMIYFMVFSVMGFNAI